MRIILKEIEEVLKQNNKTTNDIKCLQIQLGGGEPVEIDGRMYGGHNGNPVKSFTIPVNHDVDEFGQTLCDMSNNTYDNSYGGQELFGMIWMKNGDWLERGEYDGSEWWEYKTCPEIPAELLKTTLKI